MPTVELTLREQEVIEMAAQGMTCRQIGALLFISIRTVEMHRAHAMRKLGLKGQTALVEYFAERKGLK